MDRRPVQPSLIHRLEARTPEANGGAVLRFLDDGGAPVVERCLDEAVERARCLGGHLLRRCGLAPGDRVVLVYLPSLDFVEALLACMMVGIVPAAILPPDPAGEDVARLHRVVRNAQARALLTHRAFHRARMFARLGALARLRPGVDWPALPWVVTDAVGSPGPAEPRLPAGEDLAFLQYTSGSTGAPRGVRVTHANLAHNLDFITSVGGYRATSRLVWWVPQYHDFGLIAGIFAALWCGCSLTLLSPFAFLRRPAVWPEALTRYRATHTTSPNFGLELLLRKSTPRERETWDLSALERLGIGGEPIVADTVSRFRQAMAVAHLRPGALVGAYGLAEHVAAIAVAGTGCLRVAPTELKAKRLRPTSLPDAVELVSSGVFADYVRVRVVDPERGRTLPDGSIGEVWASSLSVADGYEGETGGGDFCASLAEDDGHRYLRTGDLGAVVDGQLYVTGRLKDLIIVRGQNLYPTDIEHAVHTSHPAIRPGRVAAFGTATEDGTEQVVLLVELRDGTPPGSWKEIVGAIRTASRAAVPGGVAATVVLGCRGLVSKTTSGKVQRRACRARFEAPDFAGRPEVLWVDRCTAADDSPQADGSVALVAAVLGRALGRPAVDEDLARAPSELGLDSLQVTELQVALEDQLGTPVPLEELLAAPTLGHLVDTLVGRRSDATPSLRLLTRRYHPTVLPPAAAPPALVVVGDEEPSVTALPGAGRPVPYDAPSDAGALLWVPERSEDAVALLERARCLAQRHPRAVILVLSRGAVAATDGELPNPAGAALWGFCRSLRHEAPHQGWRLIDTDGGAGLDAALVHPTPELALRAGVLYASRLEPWTLTPRNPRADTTFGGTGLVVGAPGAATRRAMLWLTRERGVTGLALLSPFPRREEDIDARLEAEGVRIARVTGMPTDPAALARARDAAGPDLCWAVLVAEHPGNLPAVRQTRGRVEAALAATGGALRALAAVTTGTTHLLALTDPSGWLGPAGRAAFAAGCEALQAEVLALRATGRPATCLAGGPWRAEVSPADQRRVWAPLGLTELAGGDDLPMLDELVAAGSPACAGLLPPPFGGP